MNSCTIAGDGFSKAMCDCLAGTRPTLSVADFDALIRQGLHPFALSLCGPSLNNPGDFTPFFGMAKKGDDRAARDHAAAILERMDMLDHVVNPAPRAVM